MDVQSHFAMMMSLIVEAHLGYFCWVWWLGQKNLSIRKTGLRFATVCLHRFAKTLEISTEPQQQQHFFVYVP